MVIPRRNINPFTMSLIASHRLFCNDALENHIKELLFGRRVPSCVESVEDGINALKFRELAQLHVVEKKSLWMLRNFELRNIAKFCREEQQRRKKDGSGMLIG